MKSHLRWWLGLPCLLGLAWAGEGVWTRRHQARLIAQEYEPPPAGMVFVPASNFWIGSDDPNVEPDEKPLRNVFMPAFYIDKFEITNRRYREFKNDHRLPAGEKDFPVTHILKRDAEAFCLGRATIADRCGMGEGSARHQWPGVSVGQ